MNTHYRWLWAAAVVITVCVASGNAIEAPFVPGFTLLAPDKIGHLAVFGLIATLTYRALPQRMGANMKSLLAILLVAAFGISDEYHQSFIPARTFDWYDFVADVAGAVIATAAYRWLPFYRKTLEWRLTPLRTQPGSEASLPK